MPIRWSFEAQSAVSPDAFPFSYPYTMVPYYPLDRVNAAFRPALSAAIEQVVSSGWYVGGEALSDFETAFARYVGVPHCVGVGNGLDALTLSLQAMGLRYGWTAEAEVVVPAFTFVATALAVVRAGYRPVFADVDPLLAVVTPRTIEPVVTPRTVALVPVHLYGLPAPMDAIMALAEAHGLQVVEDAAQAHGARVAGRRVGAWGHAAAFSFYPGKNLGALGDGGAVVTSDADLARSVRLLGNYGAARKYHHTERGVNSRLDDLQAAVLSVKLPLLDAHNDRRRNVAAYYASHLPAEVVALPYGGDVAQSVFHIYPVCHPCRDALQAHLSAHHEVGSLIHYPVALPDQPALAAFADAACLYPHARRWAAQELSLPIHPFMTDAELAQVVEAVCAFGR